MSGIRSRRKVLEHLAHWKSHLARRFLEAPTVLVEAHGVLEPEGA